MYRHWINYRGIDYGKGKIWTQHDMVNDTLSQAQRLLALGVKPENIAFEGMSMGGAVATLTAAKMHDQCLRVKLYNERSYRSLIRLMVGYVFPASNSSLWNPLNWLKYIVVGLSFVFVAPVLWIIGWHCDVGSAWDRIPLEDKAYSVVRNHQNPDQYDDDDLVHDSFSSIASLMDEHKEKIKEKLKSGATLSAAEQQILADESESHEFTLDRGNEINTNPSAHAAPRRFLVNTQTKMKTMQAYMIEKLRFKLGTNLPVQDAVNPNPEEGSSMNYSGS